MSILQDFRYALRTLGKSAGFTVVAVLILALGIGATTGIFSVAYGVLLAPLSYPGADRIVAVDTSFSNRERPLPRLTGGDLVDIRSSNHIFESLSQYYGGEIGVQLGSRAEFTETAFVTGGFFPVFGLTPAYGRFFQDSEPPHFAVVSLAFAQRNFGGGPQALGRTVKVENQMYDIVGVAPAALRFPARAELWISQPVEPSNLNRTAYNYPTVARLKPGVPLDTAQAELSAIGARLGKAFPPSNHDKSFVAVPLRDQLVGPVRSTLYMLLGAVGLILLIACANVAHLALARAMSRVRELAVRAAIGASRWRLLRQMIIESIVLGTAGGALGLLLAGAATSALIRLAPPALPRLGEVHMDSFVLAFAIGISMLASVVFGLVPAWQASHVDLNENLKQGSSRGMIGGGRSQLRNVLIVAEIALSFVLAIGGGLLFRSFLALNSSQLGFRTEGILVMYAHAPAKELPEYVRVGRFVQDRMLPELAAIPGVRSTGAAMGLPTGQYSSDGSYAVEGKHRLDDLDHLPHAGFRLASPSYFATMGIPVLRGRDFSPEDRYDAPFVAIISDTLARQVFPNEDPVGRRIICGLDSDKWMTVVGVVGDVRQQSPASPVEPELYMPLQQHPYHGNEIQVVMRTSMDPSALVAAVRQKVHAEDPEIATRFTSMDAMVSESIATPRFRTTLVSIFAISALLLAMAGVYGVMSYIAAQRTSEFGLRLALGAGPGDVLRLILGRAIGLALIGIAAGLALSLVLSRLVANLLFGLQPTDAITYGGMSLLVVLCTSWAAIVPAWRATRVDPMIALRQE